MWQSHHWNHNHEISQEMKIDFPLFLPLSERVYYRTVIGERCIQWNTFKFTANSLETKLLASLFVKGVLKLWNKTFWITHVRYCQNEKCHLLYLIILIKVKHIKEWRILVLASVLRGYNCQKIFFHAWHSKYQALYCLDGSLNFCEIIFIII